MFSFPNPLSNWNSNNLTIKAFKEADCLNSCTSNSRPNEWVSDFRPIINELDQQFTVIEEKAVVKDPNLPPKLNPLYRRFTCEVAIMDAVSPDAIVKKFTTLSSSSSMTQAASNLLNTQKDYVAQKVEELEKMFSFCGDIHQFPFFKVSAGKFEKKACLIRKSTKDVHRNKDQSINSIKYLIEFQEVISLKASNNKNSMNSPDMTHYYTIKNGDTLTKISKLIYGDIDYHLKIAEFNNLKSIRKLDVGSKLKLPPIK